MSKRLRITLAIVGGLLLLIAAGLFALYRASQYVPEFYRQAIAVDLQSQEKARHEMLQQTTALVSDMRKVGRWRAPFTAEQINAWLAIDLSQNFPDALPPTLQEPRVAIEPDRMILACRYQQGSTTSVLTLTVEPYMAEPNMAEPNVIALRIRKARAGRLPIPLDKVLDAISAAAASRPDLRLQWRQAGGDPVALISFPTPRDQHDKIIRIETLELGDGRLDLKGKTERAPVGGRRKDE